MRFLCVLCDYLRHNVMCFLRLFDVFHAFLWRVSCVFLTCFMCLFDMSSSVTGFFAVGQFAVRIVHRKDPYMQETEDTIAKYAVDTNLFRLGSTNPKKNWFFFLQKCSNIFKKNKNPIFFFSKVFKFTWKKRNRLNRKKNQISDFYFSSYGHFCTQMSPIFDEFSR